jgi:large subunit ribosomal protein L22
MAPRKVRLIVDAIRGLSVAEADTRLQFIHRDASRPVLKLLRSAVANAEHNFKLDRETLFVKTIAADAGTTLKRFRPRAMGRAAPIRKRTTHITLVLSDEARAPKATKKSAKAAVAAPAPAEKKAAPKKRAAKKTTTNA